MSTDRVAGQVEVGAADEFDRRDQILDAANECFTQLGIQRTSVQDVARMAKVSRGTIYRYFVDREVLIEAAIEHRGPTLLPRRRRRDGQEKDTGRAARRDGRDARDHPARPPHPQPVDG